MNFLVFHMAKYKLGQVTGIQIHHQRQRHSQSNPDIDQSRSKLNYDLVNESSVNFRDKIMSRIGELNLKKSPRHDAVYMVDCVMSASPEYMKTLSPDETKLFFQTCRDFMCEFFGKENAIAANVHLDEGNPHLHITHVPVTADGRLNANGIYTRLSLKKLHSDLPEYLQSKGFDVQRGVEQVPGAKKIHLNTREFKQQQDAMSEVRELEESIKQRLARYEQAAQEVEAELESEVSLPKPGFLNATEVYNQAAEIIYCQMQAIAEKPILKAKNEELTQRNNELADKLREAQARQQSLDLAVAKKTKDFRRQARIAERLAEVAREELEALKDRYRQADGFLSQPAVQEQFERFKSTRDHGSSRGGFGEGR